MNQETYLLYGTHFSYYTGKARAYLRYKQIPHQEIFSSMRQYRKVIIPKTGVRFIPVVITPEGEALQDTSVIIDTLEQKWPERSILPKTPVQRLVAYLLEVYFDEWFLFPAMHYRWNFPEENQPFLFEEFGSIVLPSGPRFMQRFLGKKLASRFSGYVPKLGISDKTIPIIEKRYQAFLEWFTSHLEKHDYLLGGCPSIADFALQGPLYAHLYRDPHSGKRMKQNFPRVAQWVEEMNKADKKPGAFLEDDRIPESIESLLQIVFQDHMPILLDTAERVHQWSQEHPGVKKLPRGIGGHSFSIDGVEETRMVLTGVVWMLQRPLFFYQEAEDKTAMDALLKRVGGEAFMNFTLKSPVERVNNRIMLK